MNIKKRVFASALVIALAAGGVLISGSHNVAKAGPGAAPVSITSPLPLPITGTATVSGTVGATQSGAWNVGITGTPSVNVGTPTVNLGTGNSVGINGSVVVGNTLSSPVLVRDVDNPGRQAFQAELACQVTSGTFTCEDTSLTVPSGKLLVIEDVSVLANVLTGQKIQTQLLIDGHFFYNIPLQLEGGLIPNFDTYVAAGPARLYATPGTTAILVVQSSTSAGGVASLYLSGYLLDCGSGSGCSLP